MFGDVTQHEHLTGVKGGYNKLIVAQENLSKIARNANIIVNVKFFLCKATVKSNSEAFECLFSKYGNLFELH